MWAGGAPVRLQAGETGSGTILGLATLAATVVLGTSALLVAGGFVEAQLVQVSANQAALAASDVARGAVAGHPCAVASGLVGAAGYRVDSCETSDGFARIIVVSTWWGLAVEKRARAGPPPHPVFGP